jgi:hypothetical protein
MLIYHIPTGAWTHEDGSPLLDANGVAVVGWAGNNSNPLNPNGIKGKNNPAMCGVRCIGPLPTGDYTIGPWQAQHGKLGPMVAELIPDASNDMHGRSGFFIHGAASGALHGQESEGCTVLEHTPRQAVKDSGDTRLRVVA